MSTPGRALRMRGGALDGWGQCLPLGRPLLHEAGVHWTAGTVSAPGAPTHA